MGYISQQMIVKTLLKDVTAHEITWWAKKRRLRTEFLRMSIFKGCTEDVHVKETEK